MGTADITKKSEKEVESASREGAYVTVMYLQGAGWDMNAVCIEKSKPKEMFVVMPVVLCKAIASEKKETGNTIFDCPVYKTEMRGPTYVFQAVLKTKVPPAQWVLAGV